MDLSPDPSRDLRDFLMSRRAKIAPQDVGLPGGVRRRVAGLRREEVALLAGVSAEYYVQIERGHVRGVSDEVLRAIATALRLSDIETTHLFDLARGAQRPDRRTPRRGGRVQVPSGILQLLDTMGGPAIVQNGRLDILAANALGRALYAPVLAMDESGNVARYLFLDETASETFPAWESSADDAVGLLRVEAARSPQNPGLTRLIGELTTRSEEFARRWARHDVRVHRRGTKHFHHAIVGDLSLGYEALQVAMLTDAHELTLVAYTAEPASPAAEALGLLASWVADEPQPLAPHHDRAQP